MSRKKSVAKLQLFQLKTIEPPIKYISVIPNQDYLRYSDSSKVAIMYEQDELIKAKIWLEKQNIKFVEIKLPPNYHITHKYSH